MRKLDIHDFKHRLTGAEAALQRLNIPRADKDLIYDWENSMFAEGLGTARVAKYLQSLKELYALAPWSLQRARKAQILAVLANIERSEWAAWTKHDHKLCLRKYLSFADRQELAQLVRLPKVHTTKLPEELLTPEDVRELLAACRSAQEKAYLFCLWESGCRIGELLTLQRKHVVMDALGAVLTVNGKTGMRRVRLIESASALDEWLSVRSCTQEGLVFPNTYRAYAKRLKVLARHAGIDKRVYPHLFRHSRATYLAGYLTEYQLKAYLGWTAGSNMAAIYVHLNGRDLDAALARVPPLVNTHQRAIRQPASEYTVFKRPTV